MTKLRSQIVVILVWTMLLCGTGPDTVAGSLEGSCLRSAEPFGSLAAATAAGAEPAVAIIVNQSNTVDNLSMTELRKIFMGERSHWPNGRRITLVMMDPAQPERKVVLREIYGMNEKDLNQHFVQGVFTGAVSVSPKTLSTTAEVLKFVFNVPGAIGYVRAEEADKSVKILRVDGRLPDDKDYKLRMSGKK